MADECDLCNGTGAASGSSRETCRQCSGRGFVVSGGGFFQMRQGCPICNGEGTIIRHPCNKCNGTGRARARRRLALRIPGASKPDRACAWSAKAKAEVTAAPQATCMWSCMSANMNCSSARATT